MKYKLISRPVGTNREDLTKVIIETNDFREVKFMANINKDILIENNNKHKSISNYETFSNANILILEVEEIEKKKIDEENGEDE